MLYALLTRCFRFWKEEVAGETTNYIHNRARCEQKDPCVVVQEVADETVASYRRIQKILKGREPYLKACNDHLVGQIAMHTVNPRYKLNELGLGEVHPLKARDEAEARTRF